MFSQRLQNVLNSINNNNRNVYNRSIKLSFSRRKLHQYNGTTLRIDQYKRSNDKHSVYRNSCLHNILPVRSLKTDIITKDNIVKSPYEDVVAPNCLLHESVWCNADKWPDMIAIECGIVHRRYTFSQLRKYARNFAASLLKSGLKPGEVVSVILPNIPEYPIALFGASEAGLIVSPANPAYTADEICHQLSDSKSVCVITYAHKLDTVKDAIKKLEQKIKRPVSFKIISIQDYDGVSREYPPGVWSFKEMFESNIDTSILNSIKVENDVALLPYSSGTTGLPKGVCLTHRNMVTNVHQIGGKEILMNQEPEGDNQDVFPVVLPFFHIYGLVIILMCSLRHGGKLITLPKFEPETYINTLNAHKSTILYSVPPLVLFLASHPGIKKEMFEQVRFVLSAAAPIGQMDIEKLMVNLPNDAVFKQGYGLTETSPIVLMDNNETKSFTSVGAPAPLTESKVIDVNTGKNLGVDEPGEIVIYGPQVMKGYLNRPEATAEIIDKDGWLHTGDIGSYDKNGRFYIIDRIKELIKVKGFQVAPAELEEILRSHPKVADAAVIGIPDEKAGELPVAFVVPKTEHKSVAAEELKHFVDEKVTKYKRLADIIFTDDIPKNPSGKILRRKIRDKYIKK